MPRGEHALHTAGHAHRLELAHGPPNVAAAAWAGALELISVETLASKDEAREQPLRGVRVRLIANVWPEAEVAVMAAEIHGLSQDLHVHGLVHAILLGEHLQDYKVTSWMIEARLGQTL